jgi:hypothetical protein
MYVLYNEAANCQMHANKDTRLINWGINTNGSGPRKNDAGCNFEFEATQVVGIAPSFLHSQPSTIYDLQGRRVANPTKGLYIVNGKKTVVM